MLLAENINMSKKEESLEAGLETCQTLKGYQVQNLDMNHVVLC